MLPKHSRGCEIGVWKGDFTERLLKLAKPSELYLIDPWKYFGEYKRAWFGGVDNTQEKMDEVYEFVLQRFQKPIAYEQLKIIREVSSEAHQRLEDASFDWIYIDGNHTYDFVMQDLKYYYPKLKAGGILCGDDYGTIGWWQGGVKKAVDEFAISQKDIKQFRIFGDQFLIQKA
ncbi:MAG: class I SAM-dependent methyltransferase [Cyclobacteriaceae bacterium]|nr:class I SAM-dependent methyltransferase [Cyclobacteriaceae bacterium SS2]